MRGEKHENGIKKFEFSGVKVDVKCSFLPYES
jgi:hypothetical protein